MGKLRPVADFFGISGDLLIDRTFELGLKGQIDREQAVRVRSLAVKPQEVITGQTESADRWLACEANMRPVPVVAMEPSGQRGISLL